MNEPASGMHTANAAPETPPSVEVRSFVLPGLFLMALGYTLYVARPVLLPIVVALLLYFLLTPVVARLKQLHIPEALGAAGILLAGLSLLGYGVFYLTAPATDWLAKVPESMQQLERKLRPLRQSVQEVNEATKQMEKMTQTPAEETAPQTVKVQVERQNLANLLLNTTSGFIAGLVAMLILLYFLLASGDMFLLKLVKVLPRLQDKKVAVTIVQQLKQDISIYLLTVTMINMGLGVATSLAMFVLGIPNPILWGVIATVLNFIPYVSSLLMTVLLGLASLLTFDDLGRALLVPSVYIVLNSLEGFVITPLVHSRRFTLNPVAIIIWLALWSWLWGITGTLLAMPMLVTLKILCEHITSLAPLNEFLDQ